MKNRTSMYVKKTCREFLKLMDRYESTNEKRNRIEQNKIKWNEWHERERNEKRKIKIK